MVATIEFGNCLITRSDHDIFGAVCRFLVRYICRTASLSPGTPCPMLTIVSQQNMKVEIVLVGAVGRGWPVAV